MVGYAARWLARWRNVASKIKEKIPVQISITNAELDQLRRDASFAGPAGPPLPAAGGSHWMALEPAVIAASAPPPVVTRRC